MFWSFRKADRKYRVATSPGKNKYLETTLDGFNKPTLEKQDLEDEPPLPKNKIIPTLKFAIFYIWIFQKTTVIQRDRKALLLGMRLSVPIIGVFLLYKFSILIIYTVGRGDLTLDWRAVDIYAVKGEFRKC